MIHGLWVGPNAVTQDFLTVMYRIQALGFNAVRLPMSFQARASPPAWRPCAAHVSVATHAPGTGYCPVCRAGMVADRPGTPVTPHAPAFSVGEVGDCPQVLYSSPPTNFKVTCNPSPLASVAQTVVQPGDTVPAGASPPGQARCPHRGRDLPPHTHALLRGARLSAASLLQGLQHGLPAAPACIQGEVQPHHPPAVPPMPKQP
jgi:hypothetical protein